MLKTFSTAWDVADDMIDKLVIDLAQAPALKGLSDTNLSTLNTQGDVIFSGAESIIQSLNNTYNGSYIFAGADTQNPPFAIETEGISTMLPTVVSGWTTPTAPITRRNIWTKTEIRYPGILVILQKVTIPTRRCWRSGIRSTCM